MYKFLLLIMIPVISYGDFPCQGRFINPITDICWSCILPISIGPAKVASGSGPKNRDTENPSSPLCLCTKSNVPIPGITIGFWEPVRLVDITRTPFCMVGIGGLSLGGENMTKISSYERGYGKHHSHRSFYHLHYYIYPLIYWLELITDFICLEESNFDLAYLSEFDVTWNDEKLQMLLNPEAFLFGNIAAQSACILDCAASNFSLPKDNLFWCAGCLGNLYPLSGANGDHVGGVQNSSLLVARILAKMHKLGLAQETSTNDSSPNGPLCRKSKSLKLKKSQYKMQMTYPKSSSGGMGCWPLGFSDLGYSSYAEFPYDGQDWNYLIWRKRNCCMF
jgi:conjugal transfer pilus assembly protein TraU